MTSGAAIGLDRGVLALARLLEGASSGGSPPMDFGEAVWTALTTYANECLEGVRGVPTTRLEAVSVMAPLIEELARHGHDVRCDALAPGQDEWTVAAVLEEPVAVTYVFTMRGAEGLDGRMSIKENISAA